MFRDIGGSGVTKGPKSTKAPRRPAKFWAPLNNWWRSYLTEKDKRPDTSEVQIWYNDNAHLIWQESEIPNWKETRIHAKCLRSTEQVKHYFREYRARRHVGTASNQLEDPCDSPGKDGNSPTARQRSSLRAVKVEPRQQDDQSLGSHHALLAPPVPYCTTTTTGMPGTSGLQRLDCGEFFFPNQPSRSSPFRLSSTSGLQLPPFPASTVTTGGGGGGRPTLTARGLPPEVQARTSSVSSMRAMFQANQLRPTSHADPELVQRSRSFAAGSQSGQQASCLSFMGHHPSPTGLPDLLQEAVSDNKRRHTAYDSNTGLLPAEPRRGLAHAHSLPLYQLGSHPQHGVWGEYEAAMSEAAHAEGVADFSRGTAEACPSYTNASMGSMHVAGMASPPLETSDYVANIPLSMPEYTTAPNGLNVAGSGGWPPVTQGRTESTSLWSVAENAALGASAGSLVQGGSTRPHSFGCEAGDRAQCSLRSSSMTHTRLSRFSTGCYQSATAHATGSISDRQRSEVPLPLDPSQQRQHQQQQRQWPVSGDVSGLNSQQQQEQHLQQSDVSSPTTQQRQQQQFQPQQQQQLSRWHQWSQQEQPPGRPYRLLAPDEFTVENRSHSLPGPGAYTQLRQGRAAGSQIAPHQLQHDPLPPALGAPRHGAFSGSPRPGAANAPTQAALQDYSWTQPWQQQGRRAGAAGSSAYPQPPLTSPRSEDANEGKNEDGEMPELERLRVNSNGLISQADQDAALLEAQRRQWARQQLQQQAPNISQRPEWTQLKREVEEEDDLAWLPSHHDSTLQQLALAPVYHGLVSSDSLPTSGTSEGSHNPFDRRQHEGYAAQVQPKVSQGAPAHMPLPNSRAQPAPLLVHGAGIVADPGMLSPGDTSMLLGGADFGSRMSGGGMDWERQEELGGLVRTPSWLLGMMEAGGSALQE